MSVRRDVVSEANRLLVEELYPKLRRFAAAAAPWDVDPDDLLQDALTRVIAQGSLDHLDHPAAYLRKTMLNLASNHYRHGAARRRALVRIAASHDPDRRGIGGFAAMLDSDPFSITRFVTTPAKWDDTGVGPFPYVTEEVLVVEPGTFTLVLWRGSSEIGPYSRWVPGGPEGLVSCEIVFEIEEGEDASLTVTGGFANPNVRSRCTLAN